MPQRGVFDDAGHDDVVRLGHRPAVEWWLRVVLDHELRGLGGGAVGQQLDQAQCHVDAARHAGGGDDAFVEVLDDAGRRGLGAVGRQLRVAGPVRGGGETLQQPRRAEHDASRCRPTS